MSLDLAWARSAVRPGAWIGQVDVVPLPGFDRRELGRLLVVTEACEQFSGGSADLDEAIAFAIDRARSGCLCAPTTLETYARIWRGFARFARNAVGVTTVSGVAPSGVIPRFLAAQLPGGASPSGRTVALRKSALQFLFRLLRDIGLLDHDPLMDVTLPPRGTTNVRPLTTAEVERCRAAAPATLLATREPAAWALLETGASTGEIGNVRHCHLDLDQGVVRVVGDPGVPRLVPLSPWGVTHLRRMVGASEDWVLVGARASVHDARRTRATELARNVMRRAGVTGPGVGARSLTAWAGQQVLEETGDIRAVARRLGFSSLDVTADLIGDRWADG